MNIDTVILYVNVNIDSIDVRPFLESIEGRYFKDVQQLIDKLPYGIWFYRLTDFMDHFNNDELTTNDHYIGYVYIEK